MRSAVLLFTLVTPLLTACSGATTGSAEPRDAAAAGSTGSGGATHSPSADGGGTRFASRPLSSPPTYRGTLDAGAGCTTDYVTTGFEPVGGSTARHPLFLYFVGTKFVTADTTSSHDSKAALAVTEAMARRGFVALSVQYDNGPTAWISDHVNQLSCLFGSENPASLLAAACGLAAVDCDLGIATWGHSQGALVADLAAISEPRVRAVWATGYGGDARATLPRSRLRLVNAEGDTSNALVPGLNQTAGFTAAECPDDGRKQCLRSDGSGWVIVTKADCEVTSADHCWFDKKTCTDPVETLEPSFVDPASKKPFALEPSADWVAATVRRP